MTKREIRKLMEREAAVCLLALWDEGIITVDETERALRVMYG